MAKNYTITEHRWGREPQSWTGTVAELTKIFSYTLLCGHSYHPQINQHPKTIKSLVSNIGFALAFTQPNTYITLD